MDDRTLARFMGKVQVQPNGCWHRPSHRKDGYASFSVRSKNFLAHRVAYEHFVGPIPDVLELDHVCHNGDETCAGGWTCMHRRCVNPGHLEPVTKLVNIRRGHAPSNENRAKTACLNGHPYTEENTYLDASGGRECRTCRAERSKAWVDAHNPGTRHGDETHCPQGHPYSGGNLYIPPNGSRRCLECKREQGRQWVRDKRAAKRARA